MSAYPPKPPADPTPIVEVGTPPTPPTITDPLPVTGVDVWTFVVIGTLFAVLGIGLKKGVNP